MDEQSFLQQIPITRWEDGTYRIGKTRVLLEIIIGAYKQGSTAEEIAQSFTAVTLAEVYLVLGYYLNNPAEIDSYVAENEKAGEQMRKLAEEKYNQEEFKARLLARRKEGATS